MDEKEKIKLSDVLGGLVSGVAYGRNVADVQALSIALRYQQNCLLKGLPVPRLRLSEVSISLPLIVTAAIPGTSPEWRSPMDIANEAAKSFNEGIDEELDRLEYTDSLAKLSDDEREWVGRHIKFLEYAQNPFEIDNKGTPTPGIPAKKRFCEVFSSLLKSSFSRLESTDVSSRVDASIRNMVGDIAEESFRSVMSEIFFRFSRAIVAQETAPKYGEAGGADIKPKDAFSDLKFDPDKARKNAEEIMGTESTMRLIGGIRAAAEAATIFKPSTEPDFYVEVDTDSIKNAGGGPDAVTRLKIVLHEEGLEWLTETHQGTETTRLMPE